MLLLQNTLLANGLAGHIIDGQNQPLAHAQILIQGTRVGTTSDESGMFRFDDIPSGEYVLHVSLIGYADQRVKLELPASNPIRITLKLTLIQLSEVTVNGTIVSDLNSPVTYSSLRADEIIEQHSVQDIPSLLTLEPGVFVTNDGGSGFGDSQILIRGFDEKRLQVLVNNIPVNDPETKEVPWSSWSALPEATQAIQVQRGVGTALYGTGAIGGAINIVTLDGSPQKSTRLRMTLGQFGVRKISLSHDSGTLPNQQSFLFNLGYLEGSGWRESSFYRGLQYYLAFTQRVRTDHLFKVILHGSPQYHTLAKASMSAASYGRPDQFTHDSSTVNEWGYLVYGFGSSFNANVHIAEVDLTNIERENQTSLLDAILMRSQIGAAPDMQVGGYTLAGDRASLNSNISHRPQLELHHNWYLSGDSKLTTTAFITRGLDYSDDVYPAWYIPRQPGGQFSYDQMNTRDYWFSEEVFEYRYYSDFSQIGILSAYSTKYKAHEFSLGVESRHWTARHAGEVLNTFGQSEVGVPIASVIHPLQESDLFYDFTTTKPQATVFGHALWQLGPFQLMTNLQYSKMRFRVQESIPSNSNYPNFIDSSATSTHSGDLWTGSATWDHDLDSLTVEIPVEYTLWDYTKSFQYVTPRLGLSYLLTPEINAYTNYSIGIKEPEIKHFYGYGAPRNDLELEKTHDFELGVNYRNSTSSFPLALGLTYYHIDFAGKLMQITLPEKANTPGYDYAGHTYVPIGDARYTGLEFSGNFQHPSGWSFQSTLSKSKNTWGEPSGTEGAQRLYSTVAVAGEDFIDLPDPRENTYNGKWDEGGLEQALHHNFVEKYGARYDVGMPQFIWNNTIGYSSESFSSRISWRYFKDLYVLEDNSTVLTGTGPDDLYFTDDDDLSATLPPALITDLRVNYIHKLSAADLIIKMQISNIFDASYWQRGDEFGLIPGASRVWNIGAELTL